MARDFNDSLATRAADRSVCGMVDRRWAHGPLSASSLDQIRPSACPMRLTQKSDVAAEVRWSPLASKHFELAASQIALAPSGHPLQQGSSVLCSVPRYSSTANHKFITIKLRVPYLSASPARPVAEMLPLPANIEMLGIPYPSTHQHRALPVGCNCTRLVPYHSPCRTA